MRLTATRSSITSGGGAVLDAIQQEDPTLDLNFEETKTLTDDVSGDNLITFSRASSGTYVDGDGLIKTTPVNLLTYSEQFNNANWTIQDATIQPNSATAPDGTNTATKLVATGAFSKDLNRIYQSVSGGNTISVHAKAAEADSILIRTGNGSQSIDYIVINLTDGTATSSGAAYESYQVESVGGGWSRVSVTVSQSYAFAYFAVAGTNTANGNGIYIWGAQVEEGSTATDYIPTTSTISGAPRFDHDPATGESLGLLIEEARTNEWLGSEDVDGYSTKSSVTVVSNNAIAPDGTNTADTVTYTATQTGWTIFYQGLYTGTYTWSGWLKTNDGSTQDIYLTWGGATAAETHTFTVTGEWQRFSAVVTPNSQNVHLGNRYNLTPPSWNGGVIDVWGIQMEQGSFPTSYIPTTGTTVTRAADVAEITGADFAKTNLLEYSERFDQSAWTGDISGNGVSPTVTPNQAIAPDGTVTADRIDFSRGDSLFPNLSFISSASVSTTAGSLYSGSLWVKAATSQDVGKSLVLRHVSGAAGIIHTLTADWTRINRTETAASSTGKLSFGLIGYDPSSFGSQVQPETSLSVYVWGAQLEEGSVATDYTPSVDTFDSRASSATYVDDTTGLIKTTPVNLMQYSEEFDNAWWGKANIAVTANAAISPVGGTTAEQVTPTASTNPFSLYRSISFTSGNTYTQSIFAKANTYSVIGLSEQTNSGGTKVTSFDLSNGTIGVVDASHTASIEDFGNGWYRCSITYSCTETAADFVATRVLETINTGASSWTADGTSNLYLWGFQLEEGSTASPYIRTTSTISGAARYENGELLLEEARTNVVTDPDLNGILTGATNIAETSVISPFGTTTGVRKLQCTAGNSGHGSVHSGSLLTVQGTASIFVKKGNHRYVGIEARTNVGGGYGLIIFDFDTEAITYVRTGVGVTAYSVKSFANGWYRITATRPFDGNSPTIGIALLGSSNSIFAWNATGDEYCYFIAPQLEAGSYPTSYIPTSGTAVTRAADVSTSALGVDSWYNQDEGTVFVETEAIPLSNTVVASINSGSSQRLELRSSAPSIANARFYIGTGGVEQFDEEQVAAGADFRKLVLRYGTNDARAAVDGTLTAQDTSVTVPTVSKLYLGNDLFDNTKRPGHIKRFAYFNTRLSDATLQNITS